MSVFRLTAARRASTSGTGALHPEAMDWHARVVANSGSVSSATLRAVSAFCIAVDAAGIRGLFYRLNLFCGDQLAAALVPLYRAESLTASVRGNTTDTNTNFVSGDYNEAGASSGLKGNGSNKHLATGVNADTLPAADSHMSFGLMATQTGGAAFRALGGAFNGSANAYEISARRNDAIESTFFTRFGTATDRAGERVDGFPLPPGNVTASYPRLYRGGMASGATATTSQNYTGAHGMHVFALNNAGAAAINHTDARINYYSLGLGMTATQVANYNAAIVAFNRTLDRR